MLLDQQWMFNDIFWNMTADLLIEQYVPLFSVYIISIFDLTTLDIIFSKSWLWFIKTEML